MLTRQSLALSAAPRRAALARLLRMLMPGVGMLFLVNSPAYATASCTEFQWGGDVVCGSTPLGKTVTCSTVQFRSNGPDHKCQWAPPFWAAEVSPQKMAFAPLGGANPTLPPGFSYNPKNTCKAGVVLKYAQTCSLILDFTPTVLGAYVANWYMYSSHTNGNHSNPPSTYENGGVISVTGTGLKNSCTQTETPTCVRSDGVPMPASFCASAPLPALSQSCTTPTGLCVP